MTRLFTLCLLLVIVPACDRDGAATIPDAAGVRVTGCDDPALWSSPALEEAELDVDVGGGAACAPQFPLRLARLMWRSTRPVPDVTDYDRVCWRVVDASPGSGWAAGQEFATSGRATMMVKGFARPVTVEGRVLHDDGTIAFAVAGTVELDEPHVVDDGATGTIAVISSEAWAERDAVHLWGQRIATDEVLEGRNFPGLGSKPFTLHRTASGDIVRRTWWRDTDAIESSDVVLGPGTRARMGAFGAAVVVDDELLLISQDINLNTVTRIPLGTAPLEIAGASEFVVLHMPGQLVRYDYTDPIAQTLAVGDGVLVPGVVVPPASSKPVLFFDGTTFHVVDTTDELLTFSESQSFTPRPEDIAALGAPIAVTDGVVFGEHGLLATLDAESSVEGPRFASYTDLFGEGHIGPVSIETATYAIEHEDDTATLYQAPGANCEIVGGH